MEQEDESIGVKDYVWAKVKGHNWWPAEVKYHQSCHSQENSIILIFPTIFIKAVLLL